MADAIDIHDATRSYERWMTEQIPIVRPDLRLKHQRMAESAFVFLRGTFYHWMQRWPRRKDCTIISTPKWEPSTVNRGAISS